MKFTYTRIEGFLDNKQYEVRTENGTLLGFVRQADRTCERRSKGKRYVNARWTSKRKAWRHSDQTTWLLYDTREAAAKDLFRAKEMG